MSTKRAKRAWQKLAALSLILLVPCASGCSSSAPAPSTGSCTRVPSSPEACGQVPWRRPGPGESILSNEALGLDVYSCTGGARPDDSPKYIDGVPRGTLCAERPSAAGADADAGSDSGATTYCCTQATTSCAYNPVATCEDARAGIQCLGSLRPEAFNPAFTCGNGVVQDELLNYCCSGIIEAPTCTQLNSLGCSNRLLGFSCEGTNLPRGEQLGANQSRADFYHLLCPVGKPAANPKLKNYCCYMPALVPQGGTCVQHNTVPGCAPGRFGFACYGPDTPDQDYLPMKCPEAGFAGLSADGYPATLFCCDFQ